MPDHLTHTDDIAALGTILTVWAHPDDETFCCGGLLCQAANSGQRVVCVTATRGEAGVQDAKRWPPERLATIRTKEMAAALKELGVNEHHWLDYQDGDCANVDEAEAVLRLFEIINTVQPDTVFTFGREGMTGHPDHMAVCSWTHQALKQADSQAAIYHPVIDKHQYQTHLKAADEKLNMFFAVDKPPLKSEHDCAICLKLPENLLKKKQQALAVMPSQTAAMLEAFDQSFLDAAWSVESFVRCRA